MTNAARINNVTLVLDVWDDVAGRREVTLRVKEPMADSPLVLAIREEWTAQMDEVWRQLRANGAVGDFFT